MSVERSGVKQLPRIILVNFTLSYYYLYADINAVIRGASSDDLVLVGCTWWVLPGEPADALEGFPAPNMEVCHAEALHVRGREWERTDV